MNLITLLLAAAATLTPLKPVQTVSLSAHGSAAADVAWLNDTEVLVALIKGGVLRVSTRTGKAEVWSAEGPLPGGSPYAELVATDGNLVVVAGGGRRNVAFRKADGTYLYGYMSGRLLPRGLAVDGGRAYLQGWMMKSMADEEQQKGALWTELPGEELGAAPLHRVLSSGEALARWRLTMHPYGGATVALPDHSVAVISSAEPGVFRYDASGKLLGVLGTGLSSLVVDSPRLAKDFGMDVIGRYREVLNRQPTIDDLVVTPRGLAILARMARGEHIQWELWRVGPSDVASVQPLEPQANGPIGHMKCESRGKRLACVTNLPNPKDAGEPGPAGSNPTLLLYEWRN